MVVWKNEEIAFILTGLTKGSSNLKTGNMVQSWIIRHDMHPAEAVKKGKDDAICGDCPLRGKGGKDRSCYVNYVFGPGAIYKAMDNYSGNTDRLGTRTLRLGSYGDPAFVPMEVLRPLVRKARKHTGYTHQWRECAPEYAEVCMASVENATDKAKANAKGYRTFRIVSGVDKLQKDEVLCPASKEAGYKLSCEECGLCSGLKGGKKKNVAIVGHGSKVSAGKNIKKIVE